MRTERFTFLCTTEEKQALEELASALRRSKSETILILILMMQGPLRAAEKLKRWEIEDQQSQVNAKSKQGSKGANPR